MGAYLVSLWSFLYGLIFWLCLAGRSVLSRGWTMGFRGWTMGFSSGMVYVLIDVFVRTDILVIFSVPIV